MLIKNVLLNIVYLLYLKISSNCLIKKFEKVIFSYKHNVKKLLTIQIFAS